MPSLRTIPFTLSSVSDLLTILSQLLESPTFPKHFLILFFSYCRIDKDILPPLFSPTLIFLVPIYHRWKKSTNMILSSSTYLVPQGRDKAAQGKAAHTGHAHESYLGSSLCTVSWRSQSWRNVKLLCPISLLGNGQHLSANM